MEFKIGDKVRFNEATKEKYQMWIDDKYTHCGRQKFCKELKKCGLNTIFSIIDIDEENWGKKIRVYLSPMEDWYFDTDEIEKV